MDKTFLLPVIALAAWSMIMGLWMFFTRVPAILKMRMKMDPAAPRGEQMNLLPPQVRWKADNYNNLMEQPTVFYAVMLTLAVSGNNSEINMRLAWVYVALRIVHSLVQATVNIINYRFAAFLLASITLIVLTARTLVSLI